MKTLNQLGISPTPWRINDHASILDRYCEIISGQYGPYNWHNAHLIVAAPKLYSACYEMLRYYYEQNTNTTVFNNALELMKQAVAEAAGESEVAK